MTSEVEGWAVGGVGHRSQMGDEKACLDVRENTPVKRER